MNATLIYASRQHVGLNESWSCAAHGSSTWSSSMSRRFSRSFLPPCYCSCFNWALYLLNRRSYEPSPPRVEADILPHFPKGRVHSMLRSLCDLGKFAITSEFNLKTPEVILPHQWSNVTGGLDLKIPLHRIKSQNSTQLSEAPLLSEDDWHLTSVFKSRFARARIRWCY